MHPWLYSLFTEHIDTDFPFYVTGAKTILELGCGTGRVLIPCAQKGSRCVGIDHSKNALETCQRAFDERKLPVSLFEMDMTDFRLEHPFEQIQIPLRSFQLLPPSKWALCLKNCHQHLTRKGSLIVHLSPNLTKIPSQGWSAVGTRESMDGGWFLLEEAVHQTHKQTTLLHKATQISQEGETVQAWLMRHQLHHISIEKMATVLHGAGFQPPEVKAYGQDTILITRIQ